MQLDGQAQRAPPPVAHWNRRATHGQEAAPHAAVQPCGAVRPLLKSDQYKAFLEQTKLTAEAAAAVAAAKAAETAAAAAIDQAPAAAAKAAAAAKKAAAAAATAAAGQRHRDLVRWGGVGK